MENIYTRRQILASGVTLGLMTFLTACETPGLQKQNSPLETQQPLLSNEEVNNSFMIGSINYGAEGVENGPLTTLAIQELDSKKEFGIPTYPRLLTPDDTDPAGDWRKHDNPTYRNADNVIIQTVHSGYLWDGSQLPADPLRAELQEQGNWINGANITAEEGAARRLHFKDAPITLQQNENIEKGNLIGIFHISPTKTEELAEAYIKAAGGPVDITAFSDYSGSPLDPSTDVIYLFCSEPYSDEKWRENVDRISQGRELVVVRINKKENKEAP